MRTWGGVSVVVGMTAVIVGCGAAAFPDRINFADQDLTKATNWTRGGMSAVVYVPPGETMPSASLQVGVIVSTEHNSGNHLQGWIREQASRSTRQQVFHDSLGLAEVCRVGAITVEGETRTFVSLQLCQSGKASVACVEADLAVPDTVVSRCGSDTGCFEDMCTRRWRDQREALEALAAEFLDGR